MGAWGGLSALEPVSAISTPLQEVPWACFMSREGGTRNITTSPITLYYHK